jgi:hypothetical protein
MLLRRKDFVVMAALLTLGGRSLGAQTFCDATSPAAAPSCNRVATATATVAQILRLDLSTLTTSMRPPDLAQFDSTRAAASVDEYPLTTGPEVTVKSNRPWDLKISAAQPTFTFRADAIYQVTRLSPKPASDLAWSTAPTSGFVPISSSTPAELMSSPTGGSYTQFTVYYRTRWLFTSDYPGIYEIRVAYTLTGR